MYRRILILFALLIVFLAAAGSTAQACSLRFTSPANGASVTSPVVTVFGRGVADAQHGDHGTVTARLNGQVFFSQSGSFTATVSFLETRGVPVQLRPGLNFLAVSGSVGGCSDSDTMTMHCCKLSSGMRAEPPESGTTIMRLQGIPAF